MAASAKMKTEEVNISDISLSYWNSAASDIEKGIFEGHTREMKVYT